MRFYKDMTKPEAVRQALYTLGIQTSTEELRQYIDMRRGQRVTAELIAEVRAAVEAERQPRHCCRLSAALDAAWAEGATLAQLLDSLPPDLAQYLGGLPLHACRVLPDRVELVLRTPPRARPRACGRGGRERRRP